MLPSLSTTTPPWHGPIADLPSGASPQPGTVSNVIRPLPIRTGGVVSPARTGRASPSPRMRTEAIEVERLFTVGAPQGVGVRLINGRVSTDQLSERLGRTRDGNRRECGAGQA